jgi:hypothetical protein
MYKKHMDTLQDDEPLVAFNLQLLNGRELIDLVCKLRFSNLGGGEGGGTS